MAFATPDDVVTRLGVDEYTGTELAQVQALLDTVADDILDAVDKTQEWADDPETTIPAAFARVSVEAVVRVLNNPAGARSTSETLGAHSYSQTFTDGQHAVTLTDSEERRLRRAVYGTTTASGRAGGIVDDVLDDALLGPRWWPYTATEGDAA